jgi:hypothetical protein
MRRRQGMRDEVHRTPLCHGEYLLWKDLMEHSFFHHSAPVLVVRDSIRKSSSPQFEYDFPYIFACECLNSSAHPDYSSNN